jgi:protein AFG1
MDEIWRRLTEGKHEGPETMEVWGRRIIVPRACGPYARFTFRQLCGEARSASDYIEIARRYQVVVLTDVPRMGVHQRNEARRLITMLDAFYDNRVKLICSADAPMSRLFSLDDAPESPTGLNKIGVVPAAEVNFTSFVTQQNTNSNKKTHDEELFAFQRAVSRLAEMQSGSWLGPDLVEELKEIASSEPVKEVTEE